MEELKNVFWSTLGIAFLGFLILHAIYWTIPERTGSLAKRFARLHGKLAELEHSEASSEKVARRLAAEIVVARDAIAEVERELVEARAMKPERERHRRVAAWLVGALTAAWALVNAAVILRDGLRNRSRAAARPAT